MGRLCETEGLTDIQEEILKTVRAFVDEKIIPVATELEHKDEYPTEIVEGLKELGLFGLMIPEEYGGLGESLLTYALAVEEIARGWMSVSGIIKRQWPLSIRSCRRPGVATTMSAPARSCLIWRS